MGRRFFTVIGASTLGMGRICACFNAGSQCPVRRVLVAIAAIAVATELWAVFHISYVILSHPGVVLGAVLRNSCMSSVVTVRKIRSFLMLFALGVGKVTLGSCGMEIFAKYFANSVRATSRKFSCVVISPVTVLFRCHR